MTIQTRSAPRPGAADFEHFGVSYRRVLAATNTSPRTIMTYLEGRYLLAGYASVEGWPSDPRAITREQVETYMSGLREHHKPAVADNRVRALKSFY